jgi:hypothetical protein
MTPPTSPLQDSAVYGLRVLLEELAAQGVDGASVLRSAGLRTLKGQLTQPQTIGIAQGGQRGCE